MGRSKRFWRGLFFLLLIAALCGGLALPAVSLPAHAAPQRQAVAPAPGEVVISEFRVRGPNGGNDEFIELYNRTTSVKDIGGLEIWGSTSAGVVTSKVAISAGTLLESGQYFLIINTNNSNGPYSGGAAGNLTYSSGIADNGGIALTGPGGTPIIDQVGMTSCTGCFFEATPLASLGNAQNLDRGYERLPGGVLDSCQDTDSNAADFQLITPSNPQNLASPQSLCGAAPATFTPTNTPTETLTATNTATVTSTGTVTATVTVTSTATSTRTPGPSQTVLINEVAWAGTVANSDDEWMELYNPSTTATVNLDGWVLKSNDNTPNISLNGHSIPPGEFLLLARRDGTFSGGLTPDIIYGGNALNNGGEILTLLDAAGKTIDTANTDGGTWPAGLASPTYASMERVIYANQWATYAGTIPIAFDRNNNAVKGTPGASNWITTATVTTITSDFPDPSLVNQDVTVNVTVVGGTKTPAGKVNVTGANTNCSITLAANGTGSCRVRFTSVGTKIITATYLGNTGTGHPPSSDTETHQVSTSVIRTPTRVPTALPPPPLIAINEFVPRPGHDWNNDGVINTGDEYIELINHGVIDVNLTGYSLDDEVNIGSTPYRLPAVTMKPGERRVFYGSETGLLLSDGGDGVRLLKPNGQLGDAYNYRVVRFPDQSYCRLPDNGGADDWNQNCYPTPGLQNSLSASSVNPPTSGDAENLCPIADTLPPDFVLAECPPAGINIWNPAYWDRNGWYGERFLPGSPGKWNVFVD